MIQFFRVDYAHLQKADQFSGCVRVEGQPLARKADKASFPTPPAKQPRLTSSSALSSTQRNRLYGATGRTLTDDALTAGLAPAEAVLLEKPLQTLVGSLLDAAQHSKMEQEGVQQHWLTFLRSAAAELAKTTKVTNVPFDGSRTKVLDPLLIDCPFIEASQPLLDSGQIPPALSVVALGEWEWMALDPLHPIPIPHPFDGAQKGQVFEAASLLLNQQPGRSFVLGFLASGLAVQFFKLSLNALNALVCVEETPVTVEIGAARLAKLLISELPELGYHSLELPLLPHLSIGRRLGHGLSAYVFEARYEASPCIVKLARPRPHAKLALQQEQRNLALVRAGLRPDLLSFVPELIRIEAQGGWSLVKPLASRLTSAASLKEGLPDLVDVLESIHQGGLAHNDVALHNILQQAPLENHATRLLLVDWSGAGLLGGEAVNYSPLFASPPLLAQLINGQTPTGSIENDLHGLAASFHFRLFPESEARLRANLSGRTKQAQWAMISEYWQSKKGGLVKFARRGDYQGFKNCLESAF